jgi:hypothetical protein
VRIAYLLVAETHKSNGCGVRITVLMINFNISSMVMTLRVTNWPKQKIPKHFYGNKSHIPIGLMIKSKFNTNETQGNESYSKDKNSKIRTALSPIENNKVFPLLTGEDITLIN